MPASFFFPSPLFRLRLDAVTNADEDGETALHFAAMKGDPAVVDRLLQSGADINKQSKTRLHFGLK